MARKSLSTSPQQYAVAGRSRVRDAPMAIYHLHVTNISRRDGRSAAAAAAYRLAGSRSRRASGPPSSTWRTGSIGFCRRSAKRDRQCTIGGVIDSDFRFQMEVFS